MEPLARHETVVAAIMDIDKLPLPASRRRRVPTAMEIFFRNVAYSVTEYDLVEALARVLHGPEFNQFSPSGPMNFHVNLRIKERSDRAGGNRLPGHAGHGNLTIPSLPAARHFMARYGQGSGSYGLRPGGNMILFRRSESEPAPGLIAQLLNEPWENPRYLVERQNRATELARAIIPVTAVQFGWSCRDGAFSVEWESREWRDLTFEDLQRQLVIRPANTTTAAAADEDDSLSDMLFRLDFSPRALGASTSARPAIVIKYHHIELISLPTLYAAEQPSILFEMRVAPNFELEPDLLARMLNKEARRTRMPYPDKDLERSSRYISLSLRVVLASNASVAEFRSLAAQAGLREPQSIDYACERRGLFSRTTLDHVESWLPTLPRQVAIQIEHLLYERLLDAREALELRNEVERLVLTHGRRDAGLVLRAFGAELKAMPWYMDDVQSSALAISELLQSIAAVNRSELRQRTRTTSRARDTLILHVTVAPSSVTITGPIPDSSNRILRMFRGFEDNFIRVAFADDDGQSFRYDPDIDTTALVRSHVLPVLRNGFKLGGRLYEYLAYSQSALKQHSFWFVHQFRADGVLHAASTIRNGMGTFGRDERCPARVGARMSLAFSATEPSIRTISESDYRMQTLSASDRALVDSGMACLRYDVPDIGGEGPECMTDGAGVMSVEAAHALWRRLHEGQSLRPPPPPPSVIQVRIGGAKGILVIDPTLRGRRIGIRPSMKKFDAGTRFDEIEICKAFTRPSVAYLNRPLIMILEARGVPKETFLQLQQDVVDDTHASTKSLPAAAALLQSNDLGSAFRLPMLFNQLSKRLATFPAVEAYLLQRDDFMVRTLEFAVNHVLRGLKYRGRIKVPSAWTLVGVPDHAGLLEEGQIFVCIREGDPLQSIYLEGEVVVSRSPSSHPGDVMVMTAIGRPPQGSPFALATPTNCVVFSTKGSVSPASCLGGGDYDGDEYVIMKLRQLRPPNDAAPATYKKNPKQDIGRPYTMEDIYEFATNFIINDQLPRIASLWLRIADSSPRCIYDDRCMKLSELHSIAVDYPKTGVPVKHSDIPRAPSMIPDWSTNELGATERDKIYESQRALGFLFRAISLPAVDEARAEGYLQRSAAKARKPLTVAEATQRLLSSDILSDHPLVPAMEHLISAVAPAALANESTTEVLAHVVPLLNRYCTDLRLICQHNTLARSRRAQLSEEEVVAGTIVARTPHYRKREDHMTRMNEQAERLRQKVCAELAGDDDESWLCTRRAWIAWKVSIIDGGFGSNSFGLVVLGALFDAVKSIEDQ